MARGVVPSAPPSPIFTLNAGLLSQAGITITRPIHTIEGRSVLLHVEPNHEAALDGTTV